jgi:glutamine synthetase type III
MVAEARQALIALEEELAHEVSDTLKHAAQIKHKVIPAMIRLRAACDNLELYTAADLWPLPTYRSLLFLQ